MKNNLPKAKLDIVDKAITMLICVVAIILLTPTIAGIFFDDVALVAILSEREVDPQLWMMLSLLIGAITTKQVIGKETHNVSEPTDKKE